MRKIFLGLFVAALAFAPMAYAAVGVQKDGTYVGEVTTINLENDTNSTYDGSKLTIVPSEGVIRFSPGTFMLVDPVGGVSYIGDSTDPGLVSNNGIVSIVIADGDLTELQVTFAVPDDYSSGGAFRILTDDSGTSTKNYIGFAVLVNDNMNAEAGAWDTAFTTQTLVQKSYNHPTPEMVTLTPATDFASLEAGDVVTFTFWRNNVATVTGTNSLEVYYAEFFYAKEL